MPYVKDNAKLKGAVEFFGSIRQLQPYEIAGKHKSSAQRAR
jgi:hypothetical protein